MTKIATKISQLDPRVVRLALFVVFGILVPFIIPQAPGMPGGVSG